MTESIIIRHYLGGDEESREALRRFSGELEEASAIMPEFRYGLRVACNPVAYDGDTYSALSECSQKLTKSKIRFLQEPSSGPTTSLAQALFDGLYPLVDSKSYPINFVVAGDEFQVSDEKFLQGIRYLSDNLRKTRSTFGSGARDSIILGEGVLDDMRKIHELALAMFLNKAGKITTSNPLGLDLLSVPAGYKTLGDAFTGVTAINWNGQRFWDLFSVFADMSTKTDFRGFSGEYYMGIKASQLDGVEAVYIPTRKDHPVGQWKRENVERMISSQTKVLYQTDIGKELKSLLQQRETQETLGSYYSDNLVEEVLALMKSE